MGRSIVLLIEYAGHRTSFFFICFYSLPREFLVSIWQIITPSNSRKSFHDLAGWEKDSNNFEWTVIIWSLYRYHIMDQINIFFIDDYFWLSWTWNCKAIFNYLIWGQQTQPILYYNIFINSSTWQTLFTFVYLKKKTLKWKTGNQCKFTCIKTLFLIANQRQLHERQ